MVQVATHSLVAESVRLLMVAIVSSDEYTAAGRDGNVLGIDVMSSSKSLQLLRISMEETWVVHRDAERSVLPDSNGSVFPV